VAKAAGIYERLARWVLGHQRLVVVATVVLTVLSAFIGLPPQVDSNLLNLLPDSEPSVAAIRRINDQEGGLNLLTLAWRHEDPKVLDSFLDDLQARFLELEEVDFAMHELDPNLARLTAMMQFEPSELADLNARLRGAVALGPALNPVVTQKLMAMGPLTERIAKSSDVSLFQSEPTEARLIVRPRTTASDPKFVIPFMAKVDRLLEEADAEAKGVELLWMGGAYRHTREDVQGIQQDLAVTGLGSALLVFAVVAFSFRSLRSVGIVFLPLLVANIVNLAFVRIFIGPLNTYTSLGTAILFGLGVDFAVHLVGRYRELRQAGSTLEDAILLAWARTGPPCFTAATTSAAGFLALAFAEFKGFSQLGVLLAMGLMLCLVAMLVLLPILLVRFDKEPRLLLGTSDLSGPPSTSTYRWAPLGLGVAIASTIVLGSLTLPRLGFEYDMSALRRHGLSWAELSEEERKLAKESYSPVIVSFDSHEEMVARQREIEAGIEAGTLPHLAAVVSIDNVLPADQEARLVQIAELVQLVEHKNLRYMPRVIGERLLPLRGLEVRALTREDLPPAVLHILGATNAGAHRMILMPKGNMWDVREARKLADEVYGAIPGGDIAGEYLGVSAMFLIAMRDGPKITGWAFLFVVLLSWWDLRKPHWVAGAVIALVTGMVWAGAALYLAGVKLTLVNLTGVPILLGIGVDVVIHLAHRLREEGPGGVRRALRTTGIAAVISTVTTICSFGSLVLAGNRGVQSLGMVVMVGLSVVSIVSAIMLPLLWSAGWKVTGRAPADALPCAEEEA
jgi:predicted RND superfamily exporter protein